MPMVKKSKFKCGKYPPVGRMGSNWGKGGLYRNINRNIFKNLLKTHWPRKAVTLMKAAIGSAN